MTVEEEAVADAVRSIVPIPTSTGGDFDQPTWRKLSAHGFVAVALPEDLGGSGGSIREAAAVVRAGCFVCGPLMESNFLAAPALGGAGLHWPGGVVTVSPSVVDARKGPGGWVLDGHAKRVPWLGDADHVVLLARTGESGLVCAIVSGLEFGDAIHPGQNIAGESRDGVIFRSMKPEAIAPLAESWDVRLRILGAVGRTVQMSAAADWALSLTIRYTNERRQFGRPLVAFQAVQQSLARVASQVLEMRIGAEAAVASLESGLDPNGVIAAAAKAEASGLVGSVASTCHQLHGAMGTTLEYGLGLATRRLWSWREEFGGELEWQEHLARCVERDGGDVWQVISGVSNSA
jgi:acyl-CoA dehydrogenase